MNHQQRSAIVLSCVSLVSIQASTLKHVPASLSQYGIHDIAAAGREQYQDIIVNNVIIKRANRGHVHGSERYAIINSLLNKYERSFTMVDLGASQGYYSLRAAHDYPQSVFVMIEGDNSSYPYTGSQLRMICRANTQRNNIVHLNKMLTPDDVIRLGECEHFDVVLAMNIVQHFGRDWKDMADVICDLGDNVIFEIPPPEEDSKHNTAIEQYMLGRGGQLLGTAPRHRNPNGPQAKFYWIQGGRKEIVRKSWVMPLTCELPTGDQRRHEVVSNFKTKKLKKTLVEGGAVETDWVPGINLMTFKMYRGAYPSVEQLTKQLEKLRENSAHKDWNVNNMIVSGTKLTLIDQDDPANEPGGRGGSRSCSPSRYEHVCKFLEIEEPHLAEDYFWYRVVGKRIVGVSRDGNKNCMVMPEFPELSTVIASK